MDGRFRTVRGGRFGQEKEESYVDYTLIFTILFLLGFGLIIIYSVSSYDANLTFGDSSYFFKRQLYSTIFGLVMMFLVSLLPYHFWEHVAVLGYIVSGILIGLVLTPLGYEANGARRWLLLGMSLQPAEVAKLGMIVFLAFWVCKLGKVINTPRGFWATMIVPLPICLMIWKITDNLSSAIIVFGIAVIMLFVASPDYKRFAIMIAGGVAAAILIVLAIAKSADAEGHGFRGRRILAWLNPEAYADSFGFQPLQSLYAIGSGGIFGKGLGQSMQKLGYLPEAQNDMIFAVICEELGMFGAVAIILLFLVLLWRFVIIANNASDMFGALLVVGVMAHIAIQVILNIAVCTSVIPNTGISLPFISYGGSSVMFLLIEIGIVMSVGRGITLKEI